MNPYGNPDKLELDMLAFDEPNMCYEFNTLCFWATKDGAIYTASDSGCSCPIPFERHDHDTRDEILQSLERVGSVGQAESAFDSWNNPYNNISHLTGDERHELTTWIFTRLRQ